MPRARVRLATMRDLDLLVRHRRGMWEDIAHFTEDELDAADRAYRGWVRARLRSGRFVGFIAESPEGDPVASGGLWLMPRLPRPVSKARTIPYLLSMFTEREHRGRGYATRIVREAVRWARGHGCDAVTLHASDFGEGIYRRAGFRKTPEMRLRLRRAGRVRWRRRPPRKRR